MKSNYRPVSILTALSKIIESIMCSQLMMYFNDILSDMLSAYRSKYSCPNVILKCIEDWRLSLDKNETIGCVAMDLSRAFDSIPHGLLIAKLNAYGVTSQSCSLVKSYLSGRKQRVKIGQAKSDWLCVKRGIPQGSLMGPVLFNIFINDLIVKLQRLCSIYNYVDDNTLSVSHSDINIVKRNLEQVCDVAIQWFLNNHMKVNPEKFQFMILSRDACDSEVYLDVNDVHIKQTNCIKLLGFNIDNKLNFKVQINEVMKRSGKQINALSRLTNVLNTNCKLKILNAFVMANFSYCCLAYHNCGKTEARNIEKMLKRALQFVFDDFTSNYVVLLEKANMSSLYVFRQRQMLLSVHKIINNELPPVPSSFYSMKSSNYELRKRNISLQKFQTVTYGYKSILYQGALLWNNLEQEAQCLAFDDFKCYVNSHAFSCQCGNCFLCSIQNM
jgi:hypothetical protein